MERLPLKGAHAGVHVTYRDAEGRLVVERHDFGEYRHYESANLLIFDTEAEAALRAALQVPEASAPSMMESLAERFDTYWAVRTFADEHAINYAHVVDFQP